ncbi:karyopherin [Schizosaccharomyces japonicus yFS275]|uniref:Karyopherin n=1 Tax=Schizosaccharomyces japonicus (strain yFS275 / FY16936) TaxID=402676 RepID=B6JY75_SCHJY|nr:karyopherin [Schizosaccharomyces japonicus yFS275]EEB06493.1 karyopherin [Schizosaccharomyces japonicus yFS275]
MDDTVINRVLEALDVVHSSTTAPDVRVSAQQFLDELKASKTSPAVGSALLNTVQEQLASNGLHVDVNSVRHFALSLFEASICQYWPQFSEQEKKFIQVCICDVALRNTDFLTAYYVRTKISTVLIELAKREWFQSWKEDFNEFLLSLWTLGDAPRQLACLVLRGIMEDMYQFEDPIAALRLPILHNALLSVLCSTKVLKEVYPSGLPYSISIPANSEGWLSLWSKAMDRESDILEVLQCFKSCLSWVLTRSICECNVVPRIYNCLLNSSLELKKQAVDCLYVCVTRTLDLDDPMWPFVDEMLSTTSLITLHRLFTQASESITMNSLSSTSSEYTFLKKLTETIVALGQYNYMDVHRRACINSDALDTYVNLVIEIMRHPSMLISAISQHFWVLALRDPIISKNEKFNFVLNDLLQLASERVLRFEDALVEYIAGSKTAQFLEYDVEGTAAVHAFCGNYRRFMFDIIRLSVSLKPMESLGWIYGKFESVVTAEMQQAQNRNAYLERTSPAYLIIDSVFTTIEAAIHGVTRWHDMNENENELYEILMQKLNGWCEILVKINFEDPLLISRLITVLVLCISMIAKNNTNLLGLVLEKVISSVTSSNSFAIRLPKDSQKIQEMRNKCCYELLRLGELMPNPLMSIYDQLESIIGQMGDSSNLSGSEIIILKTFLFVISQSSDTDWSVKQRYFEKLVNPVVTTWLDVHPPVSTFGEFINHVSLPQISDYLAAKFPFKSDLTKYELDSDAASFQSDLENGRKWLWPIKCLGRFCEATVANKHLHPEEFPKHIQLWSTIIPSILPGILLLVEQMHGCYDPSVVATLNEHTRYFLQKSTTERFWLHGVSQVSKSQFLEESYKSDTSANKLVHSFGHFLRRMREYCYFTLSSFMLLGEPFYRTTDMSKLFLKSFFYHAAGFTLHQWTAVVNNILKPYCLYCPPDLRDDCLLPLLPPLLSQLDKTIVTEWRKVAERGTVYDEDNDEDEENLSEEMIGESLLRYLSFATARLISEVLLQISPSRSSSRSASALTTSANKSAVLNRLSDYVLNSVLIAEPLLCILCHMLVIHDTRTVSQAISAFLAIVPSLVSEQAHVVVREFVCQQVFQTVIMAINDPYFESLQSDLLRLSCLILSLSQNLSSTPAQVLNRIPSISSQPDLLPNFLQKFKEATTLKVQKALLSKLLHSGNVFPRNNRTAINAAILDVSTKEVLSRFEKSVTINDDSKSNLLSRDEDIGLSSLFS